MPILVGRALDRPALTHAAFLVADPEEGGEDPSDDVVHVGEGGHGLEEGPLVPQVQRVVARHRLRRHPVCGGGNDA